MRRLAATAASPGGTYSHPFSGASAPFDGAEGQEIVRTGALARLLVNERVAPPFCRKPRPATRLMSPTVYFIFILVVLPMPARTTRC